MPSSISSSDALPLSRSVPLGPWAWPLLLGVLAWLLFAALMEARLALRGYVPALADSTERWVAQRARIADLGPRALVLVGGSRIQLAVDLDVLRRETGLDPVQLAVDGGNFVPVLADLATDPDMHGTVIVDVSDHLLTGSDGLDRTRALVHAWRTLGAAPAWTFAGAEGRLTWALHARLRSYADGASPWSSLRSRLLQRDPVPQYLVTLPDRSRYADYGRVPMPDFYLARVMRNLGQRVSVPPGTTHTALEAWLHRRIEALPPMLEQVPAYLDAVVALARQARRVQERGGRVLFVRMPTSGLVTELEERRFPRERFWDELARNVGAPAVHFADDPALRQFHCPDGSHLDVRDRARFTSALAAALGLHAAD